MNDHIAAAKLALDERLAAIGGCTDGNCQVVRPKGMHTNGGCYCLKDWPKAQRVHFAYQQFVKTVTEKSDMRHYDGNMKWEQIERQLQRDGYIQSFACIYGEKLPDGFTYTGRETGWEMRRLIKAYCADKGISDYRIVRNGSYFRDLHGDAAYELWVRR